MTDHADEGHGYAYSRDMDTGQFAPNGAFRHGFRWSGERQQEGHPLGDLPGGVEMLTGVLAELEGRLRSAVIVDFEYGPEGLALIGLEQLRRPNARVATSMAVDLVIRGIVDEVEAVRTTAPPHVLELLLPQPKLDATRGAAGDRPGSLARRRGRPHRPRPARTAVEMAEAGHDVDLVMSETTPGHLPE